MGRLRGGATRGGGGRAGHRRVRRSARLQPAVSQGEGHPRGRARRPRPRARPNANPRGLRPYDCGVRAGRAAALSTPALTTASSSKESQLTDQLVVPHGGTLVNLVVDPDRAAALRQASRSWPSWDLTPRQLCDLELLMNGGFSPLTGFLARADYERVCGEMRLKNGTLWPMPITLDVTEDLAKQLGAGATLALRDPEGVMLAALHVEEIWRPDRTAEAKAVFGTTDRGHPGVAYLLDRADP